MDSQVPGSAMPGRRRALQTLLAGLFPLIAMAAFALAAWRQESLRSPARPTAIQAARDYSRIPLDFGRGYQGPDWRLYFNEPDPSAAVADYRGGLDAALAFAIDETRHSLDIATFELNSDAIERAILRAHERGAFVRIVADDEHGLQDPRNPQLRRLRDAGIAIVDDARSGLMHNKFVILDGRAVWTGSWNFTVNGSYRNNNNALALESEAAVRAFQAEFDEMFEARRFGPRSPNGGETRFELGDGAASILFAPEADEPRQLMEEIARAESAIRVMAFVFSLEDLAKAILERANDPAVTVQGVFEARTSTASWSQFPALHCAGAEMRQDGNRYILHHKVIIIDADTVITGSFNFSRSAAEKNDENIVIVRDADIAGLYLDEWRRIWDSAQAVAPSEVDCD